MNHNQELQVVFGASGGAGNAIVRELAAQGKRVRAVNRRGDADVPPGVERVKGDAADPASCKAACQGAAVVYHCVNARYDKWPQTLPAIMAGIIEGAASAGAKLVYVDNLYMYGKVSGPMKESTPYRPASRKGALRAQLANMLMEAHQSGKVRAVIGRASDFYGPGVTNAGLGEMVFDAALKGRAADVLGDVDMPHTYTYINDLAKGMVILGERDEALGKVWHIPNAKTLTTRELLAMIYEEAGQPLKFRAAPQWLLMLLGLFNPVIREVKEMTYQFEMPFVVDHGEYGRVFGNFTPTPHREAIRETYAWFRERVTIT
ncbi:MAG: SDR family oxidoreductase [Anaerolineae bacterium]